MPGRLAAALLVPALLLGTGGPAAAQKLQVDAVPALARFATPTAGDFSAGGVDYVAVDLVVSTHKPKDRWTLYVHSDDLDLGGYGKPLGDLMWRVSGASAWIPVGTSEQVVGSGQGGDTVAVELRTALDWAADAPDDYGAILVFRIDKH